MLARHDLHGTAPGTAQIGGLFQEHRPLCAPHPHIARRGRPWQQNRAMGVAYWAVQMQRSRHLRVHQRPQIRHRTDRQDLGDPVAARQIHIRAQHPCRQMTACRMAGQTNRAGHCIRGHLHRTGDTLGDLRDRHIRGQRIGRHRDGVAMGQGPCGKMAPIAVVEPQPIPAMHEHDQTPGIARREKQVHPFAPMRPVD